ncbi:MAG: DUF4193 family protein [Candidatus Ancillula sp.]|jgi:hypothetical protein|nr:DUF4193 family protein [Candidatus Ancillula sp.]
MSAAASKKTKVDVDDELLDEDDIDLAKTMDLPGIENYENVDELTEPISETQDYEFVCTECFLTRNVSMLADPKNKVCKDCI